MKKIEKIMAFMILIITVILSGCNAFSSAEQPVICTQLQIDNPQMIVNGSSYEIDPGNGTVPTIRNGRTLVPIRAIIEAFGGKVSWDENLKQVTLTLQNDTVRLIIDSTSAYANEIESTLDTAPTIINGRTMLPIRYIADSFGFGVRWDSELKTVILTSDKFFTSISAEDIPKYSGNAYAVVNDNKPFFDAGIITDKSFEYYCDKDILGRCGVCIASIGTDVMPTGERESIGSVKPTGWHSAKYDIVDGKYLYNRCHLIGYQLTAENANDCNLITGTRYMNVVGMLPFENMTADYIKETGNHVMYRATPIFKGKNLIADGVLMEAYSVEDKGEGISFCVFCYNVQPGIEIDYLTGDSKLLEIITNEEQPKTDNYLTEEYNPSDNNIITEVADEYVLNTKSRKYHLPNCSSVGKMSKKNKQITKDTKENLEMQGYTPCNNCIENR